LGISQKPRPSKSEGRGTQSSTTKAGPPARKPAGQVDLAFGSGGNPLPRFWQRRFYDFKVWSLKKRVEKLHYMHMNPLKRKLVDHPRDWPWSSFSFYSNLKQGLIPVDPVK
jgi:hypothetical protein